MDKDSPIAIVGGNESLSELNNSTRYLSTSTYEKLSKHSVHTILDFLLSSDTDIMNIEGVGKKALMKLKLLTADKYLGITSTRKTLENYTNQNDEERHGDKARPRYATGNGDTLPDLLTEDEVCTYLNKSKAWLQRDRWQGGGMKFIKVGQSILYSAADLHSYITNNTQTQSEK